MQLRKIDPANEPWTLSEKVDDARGKLHLQERDGNAFYESSEVQKLEHEKLISKLRKENKARRIQLAMCIKGDTLLIKSVFKHRKADLLSTQRCGKVEVKEMMFKKVQGTRKQLNAIIDKKEKKQKIVNELKAELDQVILDGVTDFNHAKEQKIRRLQNEIDKARIKVGAALNITRRYATIHDHLQMEVRSYPAIVDAIEHYLKKCIVERDELFRMNEKAQIASEDARFDLRTMEREMYQAKRARDQQLNHMKKEVEKRREVPDKRGPAPKMALLGTTSDSRAAKLTLEKNERQEKILSLEDAFERIMGATHVSGVEDIIFRLENQHLTFMQLRNMEKDKTMKKISVLEELAKLKEVFEEIKFNSERQIQRGRKMVEDMSEYLNEQEVRHTTTIDNFTKNNKLLSNIQDGTAFLLEKLKEIKLKPPFHNFTNGDPIANLLQCGHKFDLLLQNLGMKKNMIAHIRKLDSDKLHEFLTGKLPADNIRIRIDAEDEDDEDDFLFDNDTNELYTSRSDIKRRGNDVLSSKLKPKKKKMKKSK